MISGDGIKVKQHMSMVNSIFKDFAESTLPTRNFCVLWNNTKIVKMSRFNTIGTIVSVFSVIYLVGANTNVKITAPQTNPGLI